MTHGFEESVLPAYNAHLDNGWLQAGIALCMIGVAMWVLHRGLVRGIESLSKIFVPVFGIVIVYLIVAAFRLPGTLPALGEFLKPDFAELTATSVFAAMGQAFFSLSLGGTFYVIYGSYLRKDERIPTAAATTASGDVGAALLAALFIVPTTLALGLDLETGPRLIFVTLPNMFGEIPAGRFSGVLFLLALWMMAFLSSLAAFQVIVAALTDSFGLSRGAAVITVGTLDAILMLPSALHPSLIGTLDLVFGSGMQVLGSGLTIVALFWGFGRATASIEIFGGSTGPSTRLFLLWLRWVVPAALAVVLLLYIFDAAA